MNTLVWCSRCQEQRKQWAVRRYVLGDGWWWHEHGSWKRQPSSYEPFGPNRYAHLFPETTPYDQIDYLRDDRCRNPRVVLAVLWVAISNARYRRIQEEGLQIWL